MKVLKAYKTELKPNNVQETLLLKHAGCARFAFNWMLGILIEDYQTEKKYKPNAIQFHKLLNSKKKEEFPWMYETSKSAPQNALRAVEDAYKRFFKKLGKFPRFKKKGHNDSFTVDGSVIVHDDTIQLPRIGVIRLKERGYIPSGKPSKATVSKQAGRWFVAVHYETDIHESTWNQETLGIDIGVKELVTCSDGTVIHSPKKLKQKESSLKRHQRKFSRQVKGSESRLRTKKKIQNLHFKISNSRKDILHKATSLLVKTKPEGEIAIEDLHVKGMLKNHKLAKSISNCGFGEFRRQIEYKAKWYGKTVKFVDRFFPSSKLCSCCGSLKDDLKLSDRVYQCECGLDMDRDLNAAINIRDFISKQKNTVSSTGINAGGDDKVHGEQVHQVVVEETRNKQQVYSV